METTFISLLVIAILAFACPLVSSLFPNKTLPETVLFLIGGMVLGPHVAGIIQPDDALSLLSDLGLGFLFLLAGFELNMKELTGPEGRHGAITWIITFALALAAVFIYPGYQGNLIGEFSVAIALSTTAFGTLVPIIKDRGLSDTRIGRLVNAYGSWGELLPIVAISLLLSTRTTWITVVVLVAFAVIAVSVAFFSRKMKDNDNVVSRFIIKNSENNSQMNVRAVVLLLVTLVTISALFSLDIVLGAFAAGFILRAVLPDGDEPLEQKLNGLGYGFFIPLFFIISGTKIDPSAVVAEPALLVVFILLLVLIRAVPIYVSLSVAKGSKDMDPRAKASVAFYCTTALPLIVAVTSIATSMNAMTQEVASVLIAAGGITVLLMPFIASIVLHSLDAELGDAVSEIRTNPTKAYAILREHRRIEREKSKTHPQVLTRRRKK